MNHEFPVPIRQGRIIRPTLLRFADPAALPTICRGKKGSRAEFFRRKLLSLPPGSPPIFLSWYEFAHVYQWARQLSVTIRTRKDDLGRGFAVWRIT